jgi:hypothetical protein
MANLLTDLATGGNSTGIDLNALWNRISGNTSGSQDVVPGVDFNTGRAVQPTNNEPVPQTQSPQTVVSQEQLDQLVQDQIAAQTASQTAQNTANERDAQQSLIDNLDSLLGYARTKYGQGMQSINDQYSNNQALQDKAFASQRLKNTQNQEKGYNEVGNFANTSFNNLNRMLQGANAGRSSVGQILAPYLVGRASDTRRQAVTDTAGENMQNIDQTQMTTNQDLSNQKANKLRDYEESMLSTQKDLVSQKEQAQIARDMANGSSFAQAKANAAALTSDIGNRQNALADLFNKYKPDYTIKEAPALNTYQVDPAKLVSGQNTAGASDFYLNQLKRKKELGQ